MKFSAQEEFGLRCLIAIAKFGDDGSATIPAIAAREGITEPHAAKMLALLRKEGFISSSRGQTGGYRLAKRPTDIRISNVLAALGGKVYDEAFCDRHSGLIAECVHHNDCAIRGLWSRVQTAIDGSLAGITLQDLVDSKVASNMVPLSSIPVMDKRPEKLGVE